MLSCLFIWSNFPKYFHIPGHNRSGRKFFIWGLESKITLVEELGSDPMSYDIWHTSYVPVCSHTLHWLKAWSHSKQHINVLLIRFMGLDQCDLKEKVWGWQGEGGNHGNSCANIKIHHHHILLWNMRNELIGSKINFDAVCDVMLSCWKGWVIDTTIPIEIKWVEAGITL